MNRFVLFFLAVLSIFADLTCHAYRELINEDRIWEFVQHDDPSTIEWEAKFAGTCVKNGTEYHVLRVTKIVKCYYNEYITNYIDARNYEDFLLREEDGKLMVYYRDNEYQVMDFNVGIGDEFNTVSSSPGYFHNDKPQYSLQPCLGAVWEITDMEINGEIYKCYTVENLYDPDKRYTKPQLSVDFVEGIGPLRGGFLSFLCAENLRCPHEVMLKSLRDKSGNYIYKNPAAPSIPEYAVSNIELEPGMQFEYVLHSSDRTSHMIAAFQIDEPIEKDEKLYYPFDLKSIEGWTIDFEGNVTDYRKSSTPPLCSLLLRREGSKLMLYHESKEGDGVEMQIYDTDSYRTGKFEGTVCKGYEIQADKVYPNIEQAEFEIKEQEFEGYHSSKLYVTNKLALSGDTAENRLPILLSGEAGGIFNSILPFTFCNYDDNSKYQIIELNKALRSDGSVVILGANIAAPDPKTEYVPLIREDRIWEYGHNFTWYMNGGEFFKVKFDGTQEVGGRTYHKFKVFEHIEKPWNPEHSNVEYSVDDGSKYPVSLLREEAGVVYGLFEIDEQSSLPETYRCQYTVRDADSIEWIEMALYDFRRKPNDYFWGASDCFETAVTKYDLGNEDYITIEGQRCKKQDWIQCADTEGRSIYGMYFPYNIVEGAIVEGIGLDGWGSMTFHPTVITTNGDPYVFLNNVFDLDGNVIYKGKNVSTSYVQEVRDSHNSPFAITDAGIVVNTDAVTARLIDLNGSVIKTAVCNEGTLISTESLPEGIYILRIESEKESRSYKIHVN